MTAQVLPRGKKKRAFILLCLIQGGLMCAAPFLTSFLGRAVNEASGAPGLAAGFLAAFAVGTLLVQGLSVWARQRERRILDNTVQERQREYLRGISRASWEQTVGTGSGKLLYYIFDLTEEMCQDAFLAVSLLTGICFTVLSVTVNVVLIAPVFLPVFYLLLPLCVWLSLRSADRCLGSHQRRIAAQADYRNVLEENLNNLYAIDLNHDNVFFRKRFEEALRRTVSMETGHQRTVLGYQFTDRICRFAAEIGIFLLAFFLMRQGRLEAGWMLVLMEYGLLIFEQLSQVNYVRDLLHGVRAALDALQELEPRRNVEDGTIETWETEKHTAGAPLVEVRNARPPFHLSGAYHLYVYRGQKILLSGKSGKGKSTLFRMLVRLMETAGGSILVNGRDIRDYRLDVLRREISYMPQFTYLINGTVLENILWGNEQPDRKEAGVLLRKAGLENSACRNQGRIRNHGDNISGGERQRIGILRCILRKSRIYLFDEPFSNLDEENKRRMLELILEKCGEKTVLIISHDRIAEEYLREVMDIDEIFS